MSTQALGRPLDEIRDAVRMLGADRVLILVPNGDSIWSASPFCAVPPDFRVEARGKTYRGICIWEALGIPAALDADGTIRALCGDCGEPMTLEVRGSELVRGVGVIHFAVPAAQWWDNVAYT